ncbi:MAG TPA: hypothetical protein VLA21_08735 [Candidatus Limnocylindria bacterium]|nr:hypothetical protein [Candidatus Limnocylindria bacterium]
MSQDNPNRSRREGGSLVDRNAFLAAAFAMVVVLCIVLMIILPPWYLKLLFLLVAVGAGVYFWLMIVDRQGRPKAAATASQLRTAAEVLEKQAEAVEEEAEEAEEEAEEEKEAPRAAARSGSVVYVTEKGDKYHLDRDCAGLRFAEDVDTMTEKEAKALNREPCSRCAVENATQG